MSEGAVISEGRPFVDYQLNDAQKYPKVLYNDLGKLRVKTLAPYQE